MRDQDVDLACLTDESDELHPMRLRYGVTAGEASRHEPLELGLSQEEPELRFDDETVDDGMWDDVAPEREGLPRTRPSGTPDDLDEEQVDDPAEREAMHVTAPLGEDEAHDSW